MHYSSPCLNNDHDQCNSKVCDCICPDKLCPECKGNTVIKMRKAGVDIGQRQCPTCNGYGRLRFQKEGVIITLEKFKSDSDVPF